MANALSRKDENLGEAERPISLLQMLAYAAPVTGLYFFYTPMWSILPAVYSKQFGLSLTAVAGAVLLIRCFDGAIDLIIGLASDARSSRGASRKPWVAIGAVGSILACGFLFLPPGDAGIGYFILWSFAFFLFFTIAEIPHLAWGSEMAAEYHRRAKLFGFRQVAQNLGGILFYAIPMLPWFANHDFTLPVLHDGMFVGTAVVVVGTVLCIWKSPEALCAPRVFRDSASDVITSLVRNRPLLLYFASYVVVGIAGGMWFALIYIYLDDYLKISGSVSSVFLLAIALGASSAPLWLAIVKRTGKAVTWTIGAALFCLQNVAFLLCEPHTSWWLATLLVLVAFLFFVCHGVASTSILGDIVDYGRWKFGRDRSATYFAVNTTFYKLGLGVGGGGALAIAGAFGYQPGQAINDSTAVLGLKLGFAIVPTVFAVVGAVLVLLIPINQRRHRIIRRRIARTEQALPLTAP